MTPQDEIRRLRAYIKARDQFIEERLLPAIDKATTSMKEAKELLLIFQDMESPDAGP